MSLFLRSSPWKIRQSRGAIFIVFCVVFLQSLSFPCKNRVPAVQKWPDAEHFVLQNVQHSRHSIFATQGRCKAYNAAFLFPRYCIYFVNTIPCKSTAQCLCFFLFFIFVFWQSQKNTKNTKIKHTKIKHNKKKNRHHRSFFSCCMSLECFWSFL